MIRAPGNSCLSLYDPLNNYVTIILYKFKGKISKLPSVIVFIVKTSCAISAAETVRNALITELHTAGKITCETYS